LPPGLPATTVWGYGPVASKSKRGPMIHNAPSLTIEAKWGTPVRVKWINDLVDGNGNYLPHLLPVDSTLHWANPPGGKAGRDSRPKTGIHARTVHGSRSDRYACARCSGRGRRERRLRGGMVFTGRGQYSGRLCDRGNLVPLLRAQGGCEIQG